MALARAARSLAPGVVFTISQKMLKEIISSFADRLGQLCGLPLAHLPCLPVCF